jgi:hypothetical protein
VGIAWAGSQCVVAAGLLLTWRSALGAGTAHAASANLGAAR